MVTAAKAVPAFVNPPPITLKYPAAVFVEPPPINEFAPLATCPALALLVCQSTALAPLALPPAVVDVVACAWIAPVPAGET